MPKKIYQTWDVEYTQEQDEMHGLIKLKLKRMLRAEGITIKNGLTELLKLHQISCGFYKDDDGDTRLVKSNRDDELCKILELISGKVIIWCSFVFNIRVIEKKLAKLYSPDTVASYYGETEGYKRSDIVARFQDARNPLKILIANPSTAGFGLTLTEASCVIYYSNTFNLEHRVQSEDRCHRLGQTKSVVYIDMVAKDTIDEQILYILRSKKKLADFVLSDIEKMLQEL